MDRKEIRAQLIGQIRQNYPGFYKLKRKEKKEIVKLACQAVQDALDQNSLEVPSISSAQALGIEEIPPDIIPLSKMDELLRDWKSSILPFPAPKRRQLIEDPLLRFVDSFLDDPFVDQLLAPPSMTPSLRDWLPSQLLRIELLHTIRFPSWSRRYFCKYMKSRNRREERAFCHLSLRDTQMPDHSYLSTFRNSLTATMRINLLVYVLHYFLTSELLGPRIVHMVDSTDVASPGNPHPLATIKINEEEKIRVYADLDSDCGKRRNKRDKSEMFVGYRVHTLGVVDVETGMTYPLLTIAAAANHHDSQLLKPLIEFAEKIGLKVGFITADEAYADAETFDELLQEKGIRVVTPEKEKTKLPENVDKESGQVYYQDECPTAMEYLGYDEEDKQHIFKCGDDGSCPFGPLCGKYRGIGMDTGKFGPIPSCLPQRKELEDIRKTGERPYNLLKHVDGLEPLRLRTVAGLRTQAVLSHIVGLLRVMAGVRGQRRTRGEGTEAEPYEVPVVGETSGWKRGKAREVSGQAAKVFGESKQKGRKRSRGGEQQEFAFAKAGKKAA